MMRSSSATSFGAECLYLRLLVMADANGAFEGSAFRVASLVMVERLEDGRVAVEDVETWLGDLEGVGLIAFYEADGGRFLELLNYHRAADNRGEARFPAPPPRGDEAGPQHGGEAGPRVGDSTETETETEAAAEPLVPKPDDTPAEAWGAWLRELDAAVFSSCPRIARISRPLVLDALRQAIVQVLPPLPNPEERDPAERKLAAYKRRDAKPVPDVISWLEGLERRAGEGRKGRAWIEAVLRAGPDPDVYLAPGFGRDSQATEATHA